MESSSRSFADQPPMPPVNIARIQLPNAPYSTKCTLQTNSTAGLAMTPSTVNTSGNSHANDTNTVASVDIYHYIDSQCFSSVTCNSSVNTVDHEHGHEHEHDEPMKEEVSALFTNKLTLSIKAIDFEVNSPSDAAIGIGSSGDSLKFDEIMHRHQTSTSRRE